MFTICEISNSLTGKFLVNILLRFATGTVLALGLIWCTGFLVVGALYPDQTDYANNMAELIVCVLTVVSIIFAFYEFVRRK